jgi:hypothetical protein
VKAGGWLDLRTWQKITGQGLVAAAFASAYLLFSKNSYWLLIPAVLHGGLVALWLLRKSLRRVLDDSTSFMRRASSLRP